MEVLIVDLAKCEIHSIFARQKDCTHWYSSLVDKCVSREMYARNKSESRAGSFVPVDRKSTMKNAMVTVSFDYREVLQNRRIHVVNLLLRFLSLKNWRITNVVLYFETNLFCWFLEILLIDFKESGTTINSDSFFETLRKRRHAIPTTESFDLAFCNT